MGFFSSFLVAYKIYGCGSLPKWRMSNYVYHISRKKKLVQLA